MVKHEKNTSFKVSGFYNPSQKGAVQLMLLLIKILCWCTSLFVEMPDENFEPRIADQNWLLSEKATDLSTYDSNTARDLMNRCDWLKDPDEKFLNQIFYILGWDSTPEEIRPFVVKGIEHGIKLSKKQASKMQLLQDSTIIDWDAGDVRYNVVSGPTPDPRYSGYAYVQLKNRWNYCCRYCARI